MPASHIPAVPASTPALDPAPVGDGAAPVADTGAVPGAADALSAMLAAAIPGTSFVDPTGSVGLSGPGDQPSAAVPDAEPPGTNGSEAV